MAQAEMVTLGKVSGVFGIKGWVKVFSYTAPMGNILGYDPWFLQVGGEWKPYKLLGGQEHPKGLVAQLEGVADRTVAESLVGSPIAVPRSCLPPLAEGEYYWFDLLGMQVVTVAGDILGTVDHLFATGANDVLVVQGERERLIPWVRGQVIRSVCLLERRIVVDWEPDF